MTPLPTDSDSPLEGRWQMLRAELAGDEAPALLSSGTVLELGPGIYTVRFGGEISDRGTYELGGTLEARTMILKGESGTNAGRTIPCIYQLVGDGLRVCYGLDSVAPTDFATAPGQQRYLATYRRQPSSVGKTI
ncbi:MAG: TIGR03067 domain-containing protein [Opitutaceae bacterium]